MQSVEIESLNLEWKENYVVYSDTDSMTDYFNSSRGSLRYMIECIEKRGGQSFVVHFCNNEDRPEYTKRVKRIAKECGYTWKREDIQHEGSPDYNGVRPKWNEIRITMTKA